MSGIALGSTPSFIIDSRFRNNGNTSNFTHEIKLNPNHRFNRIALVSAMIPKSYYLVSAARNNCSFVLTEGASSVVVTLPDGDYNVNNFQVQMATALNDASVSMGHAFMYNLDYPTGNDVLTMKYTYTVSNNSGVQPSFTFGPNSMCMSNMMGFDDINTYTFVADSLTSVFTVRFQHTTYIQIKSSASRQPDSIEEDNSVLAVIPVNNTPDGGFIQYSMIDIYDASVEFINPRSTIYSWAFYDEDDKLIDFNGQDVSFIVMVYTYNNISELQINDLHLKYLTDKPKEIYVEENDPTENSIDEPNLGSGGIYNN